jgi:Tol biopolymer transport system component
VAIVGWRVVVGSHPSILIEDDSAGTKKLLLKPSASGPKWSPDGRWVACSAYESSFAPYNLAIVALASGQVTQPELGGQIAEYRWSPDSKRLALEISAGSNTVLGFFTLATGTFTPADTLTLVADYDFRWSPDSRTLAVSKPTFTDRSNEDEVTQSDLWLMDVSGARCRLIQGKSFLAMDPRWVDATRLRYVHAVWKPEGYGFVDSLVIGLARSR